MNRQALLTQLHANAPIIAPSMLKCDFGCLGEEVQQLETAQAKLLHWDVMDGHFVPNLSYGSMVIERLRERTSLPFDAHLMISEPQRYLDDFLAAGCDAITFHVEAVPDCRPLLERIRSAGALAGLAINPGTPVSAIESVVADCDLILVMSVEPGFGGQKFIPSALEKLRQLRGLVPEGTLLSVDGGIGTPTIAEAASAGANIFVAGSSIFDTADYSVAIAELSRLARTAAVSSTA